MLKMPHPAGIGEIMVLLLVLKTKDNVDHAGLSQLLPTSKDNTS